METVQKKKLEEIILLKGNTISIKKDTSLPGDREVSITPYIFKTISSFGLGILEDDNFKLYDVTKKNIFVLYRTMEIVENLKTLRKGIMFPCYSSCFHDSENLGKSYISSIIKEVGMVKYKEIMKKEIPRVLIQMVFDSQKEKCQTLVLNLNSFADEFKNKTIRYDDYEEIFTSLGVKKVF